MKKLIHTNLTCALLAARLNNLITIDEGKSFSSYCRVYNLCFDCPLALEDGWKYEEELLELINKIRLERFLE